jgi:hypothetical protein
VVQARHGPEHLLAALRRLTRAKVFHNVYEVWYDTLDGAARPRAAVASSEASRLSRALTIGRRRGRRACSAVVQHIHEPPSLP